MCETPTRGEKHRDEQFIYSIYRTDLLLLKRIYRAVLSSAGYNRVRVYVAIYKLYRMHKRKGEYIYYVLDTSRCIKMLEYKSITLS
jgi:hypothetical protein